MWYRYATILRIWRCGTATRITWATPTDLALWQSQALTTWNFRSEYNGTSGNGGTVGGGLNHEKTFDTVHYSPKVGFNSMTDVRYYRTRCIAPNAGNTDGHQLHNAVVSDGGQLNIWVEDAQRNAER